MKRLIHITFVVPVLLLLYPSILFAQRQGIDELVVPKWKLKDVGVSLSYDAQMMNGIGYEDIYGLIKDKEQFQADMSGFKETGYSSPEFATDRLNLSFTLSKPILNLRWSNEWRIGLSTVLFSELMVEYEDPSKPTASKNYIGWCLVNNRVGLDINRLMRYTNNNLSIYGGIGARLSTTFNDKVLIFGEQTSTDPEIEMAA